MLRLVIADDHSVVLAGLEALLELEAEFTVVASCADGQEVVDAVSTEPPDLLIMDASMPHRGGLDTHRELRGRGIEVPTIILSATLDDEDVLDCLKASVDGIVLKESAPSVLIDAVHAVIRGERWIPPELAARAAALIARRETDDGKGLTEREKEVVVLVAGGRSNKLAARELGVAESTIKLHLHNAFTKLDVSNRVQLSLLARERGWI